MDSRLPFQNHTKEELIDEILALKKGSQERTETGQLLGNIPLHRIDQMFIDHISDGVIVTDTDAIVLFWSLGAETMFGYSSDEVIGKNIGEVLHTEMKEEIRSDIRRELDGSGHWVGRIPAMHKDGTQSQCDSVIIRRFNSAGEDIGSVGINRNTGWQFKADMALKQRQGMALELEESQTELAQALLRYKDLIECIPDVVWTADAEGIITYMSPSAEAVTGYKPIDLVGTHLYGTQDILPDATDLESVFERFRVLSQPEKRTDGFVYRGVYRRADGSSIDAELRVTPHLDTDGNIVGLSGITRDIGDIVQAQQERLSLETRLLQSQKMEAIGRLAGGIAHDFNNMLTSILGYTELVLEDATLTTTQTRYLNEVANSTGRAARLTQNLLAFSQERELQPKKLDVCELAVRMEEFYRDLLSDAITLSLNRLPDSLWVLADEGQLEQVLMNLVINARDALPQGGTIAINVATIVLDGNTLLDIPAGAYVTLTVTDSGEGIDPDGLPRVFEPFYTTKQPGKGTGLGLATAYGIAQQSGGTIEVSSEQGVGTTFCLYLPRVGADAKKIVAEVKDPQTYRSAMILVAEDNPEVAGMLKIALGNAGHTVLLALDGEEALEINRLTLGKIDLLVTDFDMPGMTGVELAKALTELRPEIKVLHISGFDDEMLLAGEPNFLQKPFGPKELLERVMSILNTPTQ